MTSVLLLVMAVLAGAIALRPSMAVVRLAQKRPRR